MAGKPPIRKRLAVPAVVAIGAAARAPSWRWGGLAGFFTSAAAHGMALLSAALVGWASGEPVVVELRSAPASRDEIVVALPSLAEPGAGVASAIEAITPVSVVLPVDEPEAPPRLAAAVAAAVPETREAPDDMLSLSRRLLTRGVGGEGDGPGRASFREQIAHVRQHGLDLVIVFDATGSMGPEITNVKRRVASIVGELSRQAPKTRVSLVAYRDNGDDFLARGVPLTNQIDELMLFLDGVSAEGGGDFPESVLAGMQWAITNNKFRRPAKKVVLVFGDAPPHPDQTRDCLILARQFQKQPHARVSTVSCHANAPLPEFVDLAQFGGGEAYTLQDAERLMEELLVLVFGAAHREEVLEFFETRPR